MLADVNTRRACSRATQHTHTAPRTILCARHGLFPHASITAPHVSSPRAGRRNCHVAGVGAPDQGVFALGSSSEDTLELAATKKNLREAQQRIDLLTQQVAIVEELQTQMVEQDELIAELEQLIESDKLKQDKERDALNSQLASVQAQLAATTSELQAARTQLSAMPDIEQLQAEVSRLREVEVKLEEAQGQLRRLVELEALQQRQQQLEAELEERGRAGEQLGKELAAAREQLAAAQAAAAAARQEAQEAQEALSRKVEELAAIEADVENMRKTMNKGGKKGRAAKVPPAKGSKGFASPAPAPAPPQPARLPAGAENHLRQELKQAQTELEQLQGTLDEREAQLQAAQSAVEFLTSQCKEQELQLTALQTELDSTRRELEIRVAAEGALQRELTALAAKLREETDEKTTTVAALKQELEVQTRERQAAAQQRDSLAAECAGLRGALGDMEERRKLQDMAVGELDVSLQELRVEVETAQQLKLDLAILAEAFSAKEAELEAAQGRLVAAEGREAELRDQVAQAERSLTSVKGMLSELQSTNQELLGRFEALEGSFRRRNEELAEAEARAADTYRQLAEAREQAAGLREQLSTNTRALAETAEALAEAQTAEASQRMAAQTLSERLAAEQAAVIKQSRDVEVLREQVAMLNEQVSFLSGSEGAVKKLQEALVRSDSELAALRSQLGETQRAAELSQRSGTDRAVGLGKEVERLKQELSAATTALSEKEAALALARRAAEATDSELRAAKRQVEAASSEVATMRTQLSALSGELTAVRQERDAASRAEFESLRQLQQELAAEASATLELLNKAESLVLAAASEQEAAATGRGAAAADINTVLAAAQNELDVQTELWEQERQRSASLEREVAALSEQLRNATLGRRVGPGSGGAAEDGSGSMAGTLTAAFLSARGSGGGMGSPRDMEAANVRLLEELNTARDSALSSKAEAEALQTRVEFLERELRSRDALITELRSSSVPRGSRQTENLMSQLKALQEENTKLKQSAARQQQLLNQTKKFFEKKIAPVNDLSVVVAGAGAAAGGSPPRAGAKAGGGSGAGSSGKATSSNNGTGPSRNGTS